MNIINGIDVVSLISALANRVPDRQNRTGKISGRMFGSYSKVDSLDSFVPGPFFSIVAEKIDELSKRPKGTTTVAQVLAVYRHATTEGTLHGDAFGFRTRERWTEDGATVKMTMAQRKALNEAETARAMAARLNVSLDDVRAVPTSTVADVKANLKASKRQGRKAATKQGRRAK